MVQMEFASFDVSAKVDTSYCESFPEFLKLLQKPQMNKTMLKCDQSDWKAQFQAWVVVYTWASIFVSIVAFGLKMLWDYEHNQVLAPIGDVIFSLVYITFMVLFSHLGWFMVVKKKGCCGRVGYLLWAFFLLLGNLGPLTILLTTRRVVDLVYLVMIVPTFYMIFACIKLFNQSKSEFHLPQLLTVSAEA